MLEIELLVIISAISNMSGKAGINIESSVVNVGKANAPTDGRLPSQQLVSHTGLNNLTGESV
jgi:hypothetical protein